MYSEGAQWYRRAIAVDSAAFFATQILAWTHLLMGNAKEAQSTARAMLDLGRDNAVALYSAAFVNLVTGDLGSARARLSQTIRTAPRQSTNGLPVAEVILAWVLAELDVPGGREEFERLESIRRSELASRLEGVEDVGPSDLPHGRALGLTYTYNDLAVITAGLGKVDDQAAWFLKAAAVDRMNLYYHFLRLPPWFEAIEGRPDIQEWMEEKEQQVAAQRRELEALGPWLPAELQGGASAGLQGGLP
jgi:hypothetical protein